MPKHIERYVTLHRWSSLGKRHLGKDRVAIYALPISSASESRHEILSLDACNVLDLEKIVGPLSPLKEMSPFCSQGARIRVQSIAGVSGIIQPDMCESTTPSWRYSDSLSGSTGLELFQIDVIRSMFRCFEFWKFPEQFISAVVQDAWAKSSCMTSLAGSAGAQL
jgi:hypothetical protein